MPHICAAGQQFCSMNNPLLLQKLKRNSHHAVSICGVLEVTTAAKSALRMVWPPTRITLAELIYQAFEFQQICPAERRTILAYDDFRVGSNEIRPLRRNRTDRDIINPEKQTSSVTVVALARASELFAAERMERMRDPHKTRCCDRNICTRD